jgi:nucleotide-binding universal stress UspA family protein
MTYRNIMVRLGLHADNGPLLRLAAELAARLEARVIGIAASCPYPITYSDSLAAVSAEAVAEARDIIARSVDDCETQFRTAMKGSVKDVEWRSTIAAESISGYLAKEARAADLVITNYDEVSGPDYLNPGELAIRAGRPVLAVPPDLSSLRLRKAVVAWKDTREARRAVVDALPLLKLADTCTLLEVTSLDSVGYCRQRLEDIAGWLASHGVSSEVSPVGVGGSHGLFLADELRRLSPDLIVAGAYGHSRLAEWAFGGVTRNILLQPQFCVLVSH